jgi:hypothetical protein
MKVSKILLLLISLFILISCTTHTETLLKNEKGDTRYCYLTNDHTLVSVGAVSEYNRCMNEAGAAGYKKIK